MSDGAQRRNELIVERRINDFVQYAFQNEFLFAKRQAELISNFCKVICTLSVSSKYKYAIILCQTFHYIVTRHLSKDRHKSPEYKVLAECIGKHKLFSALGAMIWDLAQAIPLTPSSRVLHVPLVLFSPDTTHSPDRDLGQVSHAAASAKSNPSSSKSILQSATASTVTASEAVSHMAHWLFTALPVLYAWAAEMHGLQQDKQSCSAEAGPDRRAVAAADANASQGVQPDSQSQSVAGRHSNGLISDLEAELLNSISGPQPYMVFYLAECQKRLDSDGTAALVKSMKGDMDACRGRRSSDKSLSRVWQPQGTEAECRQACLMYALALNTSMARNMGSNILKGVGHIGLTQQVTSLLATLTLNTRGPQGVQLGQCMEMVMGWVRLFAGQCDAAGLGSALAPPQICALNTIISIVDSAASPEHSALSEASLGPHKYRALTASLGVAAEISRLLARAEGGRELMTKWNDIAHVADLARCLRRLARALMHNGPLPGYTPASSPRRTHPLVDCCCLFAALVEKNWWVSQAADDEHTTSKAVGPPPSEARWGMWHSVAGAGSTLVTAACCCLESLVAARREVVAAQGRGADTGAASGSAAATPATSSSSSGGHAPLQHTGQARTSYEDLAAAQYAAWVLLCFCPTGGTRPFRISFPRHRHARLQAALIASQRMQWTSSKREWEELMAAYAMYHTPVAACLALVRFHDHYSWLSVPSMSRCAPSAPFLAASALALRAQRDMIQDRDKQAERHALPPMRSQQAQRTWLCTLLRTTITSTDALVQHVCACDDLYGWLPSVDWCSAAGSGRQAEGTPLVPGRGWLVDVCAEALAATTVPTAGAPCAASMVSGGVQCSVPLTLLLHLAHTAPAASQALQEVILLCKSQGLVKAAPPKSGRPVSVKAQPVSTDEYPAPFSTCRGVLPRFKLLVGIPLLAPAALYAWTRLADGCSTAAATEQAHAWLLQQVMGLVAGLDDQVGAPCSAGTSLAGEPHKERNLAAAALLFTFVLMSREKDHSGETDTWFLQDAVRQVMKTLLGGLAARLSLVSCLGRACMAATEVAGSSEQSYFKISKCMCRPPADFLVDVVRSPLLPALQAWSARTCRRLRAQLENRMERWSEGEAGQAAEVAGAGGSSCAASSTGTRSSTSSTSSRRRVGWQGARGRS